MIQQNYTTFKKIVLALTVSLLLSIANQGQETPIAANATSNQYADGIEWVSTIKSQLNTDTTTHNLTLLGMAWETLMQLDSAEAAYRLALERDTLCSPCRVRLAGVLASMGRVKEATELYSMALEQDSTSRIARTQLARLLKREGRFAPALSHFQWLMATDSTNSYLWEQVGDCAIRTDGPALALDAYTRSFDLNPANMPLAAKLITTFTQTGMPPMLILPIAAKALEHDSTYTPVIRGKGYIYFLGEDYTNSQHWLGKAHTLGDTSRFTLKYLGISKFHNGNFWDAADLLNNAYSLDTTDRVLNYVLARSLISVGEREQAIAILNLTERLITPDPEELSMLYATRAEAFVKGGDYPPAIEQYQKAIELNPEQNSLLFEIGQCYLSNKDSARAKDYISRYIALETANRTPGYTTKSLEWAKTMLKRIEEGEFWEE